MQSPPPPRTADWNEYKTQTVKDCELKAALREMDSWITWNSSPSYLPHTKNIPLYTARARHAGSSGQRSSLRVYNKANIRYFNETKTEKGSKLQLKKLRDFFVLLNVLKERCRFKSSTCVWSYLLFCNKLTIHLRFVIHNLFI